jgi:hypothetical protein
MRVFQSGSRSWQWAVALAAVCWLSIVLGAILTRMPYVDEGYYTLSPYSRIARGDWGAHEIEPSAFIYASIDKPLTRIDRRAYWVMPLESLLQAGWYRLVGWGLVQQRLLSVAAGLLGILIWFDLTRRVSRDVLLAGFATLLIAFDWTYVTFTSMGRPDMLGFLFGLAALYAHETFFASRPLLARLLSAASLCAVGMIHPLAAVVWGAVYGVRCLLQWRRITLAQIAVFFIPVAVTGALFAVWIGFDPVAFWDQMAAQSGFRTAAVRLDEWRRYFAMYGLLPKPFSGDLLKLMPALTLLGAAVILWIRRREAAGVAGLRLALLLGGVAFLVLTLADDRKWAAYGLHVVPWIALISAYAIRSLWNDRARMLVAGWVSLYVLAAILAGAYVVQRRSFDRVYRPAVAALAGLATNGETVFAPAEFRFAYPGSFLYDARYGFLTGKPVPAIAVAKEDFSDALHWSQQGNPRLHAYLQAKLNRACQLRYENEKYAVYACAVR